MVTTPHIGRKYVEAGFPENGIITAPNGVDPEHFRVAGNKSDGRRRLGLPLDRPIIVYVGNFRNTMGMEKGVPELIRAHGLLSQRFPSNPPLLLCVGGPSRLVPGYERLAAECGIDPKDLRFVPFVDRGEVPLWLHACASPR